MVHDNKWWAVSLLRSVEEILLLWLSETGLVQILPVFLAPSDTCNWKQWFGPTVLDTDVQFLSIQ